MMDLKKLYAQLSALNTEAQEIINAADGREGENACVLTDEESARIEAIYTKADGVKAQIDAGERGERLRARAAETAEFLKSAPGRKTAPSTQIERITVKERWEDDPRKGFKTPADFMRAVVDFYQRGKSDPRLNYLRVQATAGSDEQGTYADPYGGFLVPAGFSPTLLEVSPEADPVAARVTPVPMATPAIKIPYRVDKDHTTSVSGGFVVSRNAEALAAAVSRMKTGLLSLQASTLSGAAYATNELLTDSPISFAALIARGFADAFRSELLDERINGTGVGQFTGVLNSPCLVTVSKENDQPADTLIYDNIINMRARCWRYGGAVWLANHDCIPQLAKLNVASGTAGSLVWAPSANPDIPDVLLGRPIIFTEYCKTVGTLGDLLLGTWSEYVEGLYQPLQSAESIHVRFLENENTYRFTMRNCGAPWWDAALTPKNSTATLSPFVVLESRD